jgi:ribosomal protein S18 acetylase RimI-like enzyme/predicted nucleic acid-binding protein
MANPNIVIAAVAPDTDLFEAVLTLWRLNSATLGYMPRGGFVDHASRKHILAATEGSALIGYVMYRTSPEKATIVHLCVDNSFRGKGHARLLLSEVIERTKQLPGVGLRCRSDFPANAAWPRLGFIPLSERAGRSSSGEALTFWWRDNGHPSLFSFGRSSSLLRAALDANVVFDLDDSNEGRQEEAKALLSDWLTEFVEYCVTEEMYHEVQRQRDSERRNKSRSFLQSFRLLGADQDEVAIVSTGLKTMLPPSSQRDESDVRHIASAIVAGVPVFITRDERLLNAADQIFDVHALRVIRPAQLIIEFDAMLQQQKYQSQSVAGTRIELSRPTDLGVDGWVNGFLSSQRGEKGADLKRQLLTLLSRPKTNEIYSVKEADGNEVGLFALSHENDQLRVPLLRLRGGTSTTRLARYLLMLFGIRAAQKGAPVVRIEDQWMSTAVQEHVASEYRQAGAATWVRAVIGAVGTAVKLKGRLESIAAASGHSVELLNPMHHSMSVPLDPASVLRLEKDLWPCRVIDSGLPSYVVSIQPRWAGHLVDFRLVAKDLFGADVTLALNRNSIYYRSRRKNIAAPARILWYVSSPTMQLRACSLLDQTVVGPAKALYRQFRREGVYLWHHLADLTGGDADKEIMALQFSETELFDKPIKHDRLQAILKKHGVKTQLLSPTKVPDETFAALYSEASGRVIER